MTRPVSSCKKRGVGMMGGGEPSGVGEVSDFTVEVMFSLQIVQLVHGYSNPKSPHALVACN